jgi:hypothetical protein
MDQQVIPPQRAAPGAAQRRSPAVLVTLIAGVVVLVAGGIGAAILLSRGTTPKAPDPSPQQAATAPPAEPTLRPAKFKLPAADLLASADEMVEAYTADEAAGTAKYKGKVIDVTGAVFGKPEDAFGGRIIALGGGAEKFRGVRCQLHKDNAGQFDDVDKGENVTIRGRCDDLSTDIVLKDCAVLVLRGEKAEK